jgi:L-seryl-tRNA(Ser) seleniumtransferase
MPDNPYRKLPQVARVLDAAPLAAARAAFPPDAVAAAVRAEVEILRIRLDSGEPSDGLPTVDEVARRAAGRLATDAAVRLRPVINATGIVLHTNLGRSPLAESAARAAYDAGRGYLNLELDLASGRRSSRQLAIRSAVCALTGAESATAVNNCAAATVITLRALAAGREVVVSRGQLIEIGGSFRIPEIMAVSGAVLREVGTTNITRLADYERAVGLATGLLMRIHPSNYRVRGFTESVGLEELVALGRKHNLPVVDDIGSGAMIDLEPLGLPGEPLGAASIRAGADLVLFSGDKLLGGPQAGIIAGRADLVRRIEKDPLMRAFRLDKMTLAALAETLKLYRHPGRALAEVPTLRMLATPAAELRRRCERLAARFDRIPDVAAIAVRDDTAFAGGGSLPDQPLATVILALRSARHGEEEFAARLRTGSPAVVGRVHNGELCLDLRTVFEEQEDDLFEAIRAAASDRE